MTTTTTQAEKIVASLTKWNNKQSLRQNLMTDSNRAILKSALSRHGNSVEGV